MAPPKGHEPYNKNGEGGRPLKYTEEVLNKLAEELEEWMKEKDNLFIERFCLLHDFPEDAIADFSDNYRFSRAYKKFKSKQKAALIEGSLKRKYAHPMCALVLSHSHGMHMKTEQTISGSASNPLSIVLNDTTDTSKDLIDDIP